MQINPAASSFNDYIMGRSSEEYQRLRAQSKMWEFATRRILQQHYSLFSPPMIGVWRRKPA